MTLPQVALSIRCIALETKVFACASTLEQSQALEVGPAALSITHASQAAGCNVVLPFEELRMRLVAMNMIVPGSLSLLTTIGQLGCPVSSRAVEHRLTPAVPR